MAGSMLLRGGSMRRACLKLVQRGGIHNWSMEFMQSVVTICACSAVTTNIGSKIIHTASRKAWPAVT